MTTEDWIAIRTACFRSRAFSNAARPPHERLADGVEQVSAHDTGESADAVLALIIAGIQNIHQSPTGPSSRSIFIPLENKPTGSY